MFLGHFNHPRAIPDQSGKIDFLTSGTPMTPIWHLYVCRRIPPIHQCGYPYGPRDTKSGTRGSQTKSWDMTWGYIPPPGASRAVWTQNTCFEIFGTHRVPYREAYGPKGGTGIVEIRFKDGNPTLFLMVKNQKKILWSYWIIKNFHPPPPTLYSRRTCPVVPPPHLQNGLFWKCSCYLLGVRFYDFKK